MNILSALLIWAFIGLYLYLVYLASEAVNAWIAAWWHRRRRVPPVLPSDLDELCVKEKRERRVYEVIVAGRYVPHTPGLTTTSKRLDGTLTFPKGKIH